MAGHVRTVDPTTAQKKSSGYHDLDLWLNRTAGTLWILADEDTGYWWEIKAKD